MDFMDFVRFTPKLHIIYANVCYAIASKFIYKKRTRIQSSLASGVVVLHFFLIEYETAKSVSHRAVGVGT